MRAAQMQCDKHVPKMVVESAQMLASAVRRRHARDEQMPLNQQGNPYKGGYKNHPCTVWAGDCRENFQWLAQHAAELLSEYLFRFGKVHACTGPISRLTNLRYLLPYSCLSPGGLTPVAQAMPDKYKSHNAITAYRNYYRAEKASFARWERGRPAPEWWAN